MDYCVLQEPEIITAVVLFQVNLKLILSRQGIK